MKPDNELTHSDWQKLLDQRTHEADMTVLAVLDGNLESAQSHAREWDRLKVELKRVSDILDSKDDH